MQPVQAAAYTLVQQALLAAVDHVMSDIDLSTYDVDRAPRQSVLNAATGAGNAVLLLHPPKGAATTKQ